ncbi:MAG: 3-deoxy-manno-octulosonate cytidylyltransferase [Deltaproteobacteria bacterium]|nr:3-deoxy-manno-octulosonate cytidylyltransferase [Deltaproteobacteria bacterium]
MSITAFIPSRYSSTRFPGKPLAMIAGKSMIQRACSCALKCPDISDVYVVTDDERIMESVKGFGGKAVMTSKNHPSGTDRIAEAVEILGLNDDDIVVNIQGDQPLFSSSIISQMVKPLVDDKTIPMSTVKYRISDPSEINNSNIVKVVTDNNGFALYFSRCAIPFYRDMPPVQDYYKHLGFYAYRKRFILEFKRLPVARLENTEKLEPLRAIENGFRIKVVETDYDSIEVDAPVDIKKVEKLLESLKV